MPLRVCSGLRSSQLHVVVSLVRTRARATHPTATPTKASTMAVPIIHAIEPELRQHPPVDPESPSFVKRTVESVFEYDARVN